MDRAATLLRLNALVEPGGAVVHFDTGHADVPANAWAERFRALRRRYAGEDPERPGAAAAPWVRHEAFMLDSPFSCVESHAVYERRTFEAARLVNRAFSMSSRASHRLGDRAADMERDILDLIRAIAPDGSLTEVFRSSGLIARRPGEESQP